MKENQLPIRIPLLTDYVRMENDTRTESRSVLLSDIKTLFGVTTYKKYVALVNQDNGSAPVIGPDLFTPTGPIDNTIGPIVWTRVGVGNYRGTLVGAFTLSGTWFSFTIGDNSSVILNASRTSNNTVDIFSADDAGTLTDGLLSRASLEIRVYP